MLPIALNIRQFTIVLIGKGEKILRRKEQLEALGAANITLLEDVNNITPVELKRFRLVLGAELSFEQGKYIADLAREFGILVNIEDQPEHCDFYYASFIKRGDLMLSVHSNGKSPALTKRIRDKLAELFPMEWAERLEDIASRRLAWIKEGANTKEVMVKSDQYIDQKGWF